MELAGNSKERKLKRKLSLILLSTILFAACNFNTIFEPSWDDPVKNFFDEYTNTASIGEYSISPNDLLLDKYGYICIPWTEDHEVTFYLRNPQHFSFVRGANMNLDLAGNADGNVLSGMEAVTIEQDPEDPTILKLTYPTEFLQAHATGTDISPLVNLFHPVSQADFGVYSELKLSSNSVPPTPNGAVVLQTNETPSTWVVCFNLPEANTINKFHNDIESFTFKDTTYNVNISNGVISYESDIITTTRPGNIVANARTGVNFTSDGQSTYIFTNDIADENNKIYTLKFVDKAGLSSTIDISAQGSKLTSANAYNSSDTAFNAALPAGISNRNVIQQDSDGNAQIVLHAFPNTLQTSTSAESQTYDADGASIIYEIYSDATCLNLIKSGTITGLTGTINLPNGTSYIKAIVRKPLYVDSDPVIWQCHSICTRLYVSSSGNDTDNNGSKEKPFATVQKAVQVIENGILVGDYTSLDTLEVILLSDITADSAFDFSSNNDSFVNFSSTFNNNTVLVRSDGDTIRTISANQNSSDSSPRQKRVMTVAAGTINLTNINLSSGYNLTTSNSGSGAGLAILGGSVVYTNGSVSGNTAYIGGGIYLAEDSSLSLNKVTISDNVATSTGGGLYAEGNLTLAGQEITINSNTLSNGSAGNLYLTEGKLITVSADIGNSSIAINKVFGQDGEPTVDSPVIFTQGYGNYNSSAPGSIFTTENEYPIGSINGEAAFTLSGGTLYVPTNYSFTTSLATAAANGNYYFYPGQEKTFTLTITPSFVYSGTTEQLYYNYQDQELYTDSAMTQAAASGVKVGWTAALYCGLTKVHDFNPVDVGGGIITIPTTICYEDTYILKVTYTYMGLSYNSNYTIYGSTSNAYSVVDIIPTLTENTTITITGATDTDGLAAIKVALESLYLTQGSAVQITLDLSGTTGLTEIADNQFYRCYSLGSIILPSSVTSIGESAFEECRYLTSLPNLGNVTSIGSKAFRSCDQFTEVTLPDSVTSVGSYFVYNYSNLSSIVFSNNITELPYYCVWNLGALTSITLPLNLTTIRAFAIYECSNLTNITYPGTIEQWNNITKDSSCLRGLGTNTVHCSDGDVSF